MVVNGVNQSTMGGEIKTKPRNVSKPVNSQHTPLIKKEKIHDFTTYLYHLLLNVANIGQFLPAAII